MSQGKGPPHPILRIKKDAERDVEFHYDKEKRLSMHRSSRPFSKGNAFFAFFRRGRLPSLLPVVLIALVGLAVFRFFPRPANHAAISGFEATLRVLTYKDSVLLSVTFARDPRSPRGSETPVARIEFALPDSGKALLVSGALDEDLITIRGTLGFTGKDGKVTAQVSVGRESRGLSQAIPKP